MGYGFGGIPANLIPGFNPNLLNTMAFMQRAAANAAAAGRDSDTVTLDDELEEGEISPPDTPTPPKPPKQNTSKKEPSPDVEILVEKKDPKKEEAKKTRGGKNQERKGIGKRKGT